MTGKIRASLLSLAIITVLVFSAVSPLTVRADDEGPTQPAPTEVTPNPDGGTTQDGGEVTTEVTFTDATPVPDSTEGAVVEDSAATPVATEEAVVDAAATPLPTEEPAVDGAADSQPTEEAAPAEAEAAPPAEPILSEVPDNTAVTVLDANGVVQPLATTGASEAIATSDPIWCPGNQAPTPGANGCTQSFNSFDELLSYLSGNAAYSGPGTIYIQQGAYQGNDPNKVIDFNSPNYDLSNINHSDLTVTGGWNTSTGTIDPAKASSFNNYTIRIGSSTNPWGGSVTINNISMDLAGLTDATTNGITVYAQNDILVSNLNVKTSPNNGAELHAGRDVSMRDSKFSRNLKTGVVIQAGRNVAIANSDFSNGVRQRRQHGGLDITSGASTSLFGVITNNNRDFGTNINAGGPVTIANSTFSGTKEMLGPRTNPVFGGYGLKVVTVNAITLDNVTGNDNFLWGASLKSGGDIAISNSVFSNNTTASPGYIDDTGLFIDGGANVALNNVTANDNRLYGAQIKSVGSVSINNSNFNNNRGVITTNGVTSLNGHGLQIDSLADIFINNTNATGNMLFGGQLKAGGEVAISNSNFSDTTTSPDATDVLGKGLEIVSAGNTSLTNVVLSNNQTDGADIQAGGDVYLDTMTVTDNGGNGVILQANCTHVFGGLYSGNGQYGLSLGTSGLDMISPAFISGNAAGNLFPATPPACVAAPAPVANPGTPGTPAGNGETPTGSSGTPAANNGSPTTVTSLVSAGGSNSGSANLFVTSYSAAAPSAQQVSLSSYMANARTGLANTQGLFIGAYAYVESEAGLQILAFFPAAEGFDIAMSN